MPKTGVILIARAPLRGRVKTRLAAAIGEERALHVYQKLLAHVVTQLLELPAATFIRAVFLEPAEEITRAAAVFSGCDLILPQCGNDLGARMFSAVMETSARHECSRVIVIGPDIPDLSGDLIVQAADSLATHDLVIGPTDDGGYYLIGSNRPIPELFEQMAWSTESVCTETLRRAEQLRLRTCLLPRLRDLDTLEDLQSFPQFSHETTALSKTKQTYEKEKPNE